MGILLLALLLFLVFFALGLWFVKFLLWVAIVLAFAWLIGFFVRDFGGHQRWSRWSRAQR